MKIRKFTAAAVLLWAGLAWAQNIDPWLADGLNKQIQENRQNSGGGGSRGPSAAEIRAWHEREAQIQAEIAQLRATPFWMAIVKDFENHKMGGSGGYSTEQGAIEAALKNCPNCKILATFFNACAVVVGATSRPLSEKDMFIGIDKDDEVAAAKAMQSCQAVHGNREDRCFYSTIPTKNGTAFCTGYDYSVYEQE